MENRNVSGMPLNVDEDADWDIWEAFLDRIPKEELVNMMLTAMSRNEAFMKFVYRFFGCTAKEEVSLLQMVKDAFERELEEEKKTEEPDVQYLTSLCFRFMDQAKNSLNREEGKAFLRFMEQKIVLFFEEKRDEMEDPDLMEDLVGDIRREEMK